MASLVYKVRLSGSPAYLQVLVSDYTPTRQLTVVKAASLTEAFSQNWNRKTCVQPSCSNCLERFAARLTFCWDTRTIQICDEETFLRTGFYKLITWLFPLQRFVFLFLTTHGALPNTYNNNNDNNTFIIIIIHINRICTAVRLGSSEIGDHLSVYHLSN